MTLDEALQWLETNGTKQTRDGMARYGITAKEAFGITMGQLLKLAREIGVDHQLSLALWKTGWYEARLLASLIGDPAKVTSKQMDAWAKDFENWGDCDTVCFKLFDRSPLAWDRIPVWVASPKEFIKRGGFVLIACLALHDKAAVNERFRPFFALMEEGARDERNFVKKGVVWALRAVAGRGADNRTRALDLAARLAASDEPSCKWIGKEVLREVNRSASTKKTAPAGTKNATKKSIAKAKRSS